MRTPPLPVPLIFGARSATAANPQPRRHPESMAGNRRNHHGSQALHTLFPSPNTQTGSLDTNERPRYREAV